MGDISIINVILPILTIGGAGLATWFLTRKSHGSGDKMKASRGLHDMFTKKSVERMESLRQEQTKVVAEIDNLNQQPAEIQAEIRTIVDDAAVRINAIAKKNTVAAVDADADEGWENL